MDLSLEANRNSALFSTMLEVLSVYNPLLHKARPMTVNGVKHRIKTEPTGWGNTLSNWNGQKKVRFDIQRIGSLYNFSLRCAIRFPGTPPNTDAASLQAIGYRGSAKTTLTTGNLDNTNDVGNNTARGRLDRIYADKLLGFNMIERYVVMSKSRQIFSATGEYLLTRFMQLDSDMKDAVLKATTPVNMDNANVDETFYAPGTTYQMNIPLWMFFNEHITNALDVNFTEEVYIEVSLRSPNELFYYGNLGDLYFVPALQGTLAAPTVYQFQGTNVGRVAWDQSTNTGSYGFLREQPYLPITSVLTGNIIPAAARTTAITGQIEFGTATVGTHVSVNDVVFGQPIAEIAFMQQLTMDHIRGIGQPMTSWNSYANEITGANVRGFLSTATQNQTSEYGNYGWTVSGTTFAFPNVDNLGESMTLQMQGWSDFLVQDTDAARALRAQQFPEGTGLTQIVYDTQQETYRNLKSDSAPYTNTLLSSESGGNFVDPEYDTSGISAGSSQHYVDLQLRNNNLVMSTSFMVRKESDFGGDNTTNASKTVPVTGRTIPTTAKILGAHRLYTRCIPVQSFQVLSAGRVIYESDAKSQVDLVQSSVYSGTNAGFDQRATMLNNTDGSDMPNSAQVNSGFPTYIYTINWGLQASRLENTGALSLQNLNNPTLRIYFRPDTWAEYPTEKNATDGSGVSEAMIAAAQGVRVDVIHEYFNVITINSGNGEITSGLNQ